ncbi:hypothetical protein N7466_003212 [Penicillium verhagenii]|uniref:uncharacterized protein n=1 Tax=Penicillium verhagenii TaxID=1562060 RepID=UPI002544E844|nr:uncharacterized protein N7466_003212 [Penicillium verhagenii]KAJ5936762.1 hypothetical protein N7466_003212 [Penicillium verhagenii]
MLKETGSVEHPEDNCSSSCQTRNGVLDSDVALETITESVNGRPANQGYTRNELMEEEFSIERDRLYAQMEVLRKQMEDAKKQTQLALGTIQKLSNPLPAELLPIDTKAYSTCLAGPWLRELYQSIEELVDKVRATTDEVVELFDRSEGMR